MPELGNKKKLSVLIVTTDRQIDRRTLQQANSLDQNGWHVTILAMEADGLLKERDDRIVRIAIKKESLGLTGFSLLSCYQLMRRHIPINGWIMKTLRRIAWRYFTHPEKLYTRLFNEALKTYTPSVIIAVDLPTLPAAAQHAQKCGAKLVYDSHELYSEQEFSKAEKKQWQVLEKKYIGQCDAVITVNPSIAAELQKRYQLDRVDVIYNAIDAINAPLEKVSFHTIFHLPTQKKILLFQGGLSKGRHLDMLVKSMQYVKNKDLVLVILGDGQYKHTLMQWVNRLNINDRVYFHEAVSQQALLSFTQSADAGIIPYQAICLNNYYCTPNKLFEFIAAGIPIIGSDLPEINRIVMNNQLGLTGSMSDPQQLAELIDSFFSSPEKMAIWRENVRQMQAVFSWRKEEEKFLTIVKEWAT